MTVLFMDVIVASLAHCNIRFAAMERTYRFIPIVFRLQCKKGWDNMKKMRYVLMIAAFFALAAGSIWALADPSVNAKWGKYLAESAQNNDKKDIYAVGKTATIYVSDIEKAERYYTISGMSEQDAHEKAYEFCKEKEALYQEAVRLGYSATKEEIQEYLSELKTAVDTAANSADFRAVMEQFESEEKYWEYLGEVYQKDLPIQKMNQDKEKEFFERNAEATEEQWQAHFTEWKKSLTEAEHFERH